MLVDKTRLPFAKYSICIVVIFNIEGVILHDGN